MSGHIPRRARRLALVVLALAGACGPAPDTTIISGDGHISLTVPAGWKEGTFESPAPLKLARSFSTAFAQALSEAKADVTLTTLDAYAERLERAVEAKTELTDREATKLTPFVTGAQHGVAREVRGTAKEVRMSFWRAYLETPTRWVQFQCWASISNYPEIIHECEQILATLQERDAPARPD